jgi:hypothetical protein
MPAEDRKQARLAKKVARADKRTGISLEWPVEPKMGKPKEEVVADVSPVKDETATNVPPVQDTKKEAVVTAEAPTPSILSNIVSEKVPEKQIEASPDVIAANVTKDEVNKAAETTPSVGNTILEKVITDQNSTTTEIEQAKILKEAADIEEAKLKAEETDLANKAIDEISNLASQETDRIIGDGSMVSDVVASGGTANGRPSYEATATKDQVEQDVVKDVRTRISEVPEAVVERLGVQDYYPNINKDINVGTFSGRYIGSVPIFAAPGARLPMGLYDARKRALVEAAKAKQAKIDAIRDLPDVSYQYKDKFNELSTNTISDILEKHNYDPEAVMRDRDSVAKLNRIQAKAKEITGAVAWADDIRKKGLDKDVYQPDEILDLSQKILSAQIDNFDDIYEGKSNMTSLLNDAKVYMNGMPWVTEQAKWMLDPKNMSESPLNLKTGGEYNSKTWIDERDAFLQEIQDPNYDTTTYATGVNKYFGGKYKDMIDAWIDANNGSEEQAEELKKTFASMIQPSTLLTYKTDKNANQWQANLAQKKAEFEYTKKTNEASLFSSFDGQMTDAINDVTKKSFQQEIASIDPNLSPTKRADKITQIAKTYFPGTDVGVDKLTGAISSYIPKFNAKLDTKPTLDRNGKQIRQFQVEVKKPVLDSKGKQVVTDGVKQYEWVGMNLPADRISKSSLKIRSAGTTQVFSDTDKANFGKVSPGTISTKVIRTELLPAFIGKNGVTIYLKADGSNLAQYNASKNKCTISRDIEKAFSVTIAEGIDGTALNYIESELPGELIGEVSNISNAGSAANKDIQWEYKAKEAAKTFGSPSTIEFSSGGGESSEE